MVVLGGRKIVSEVGFSMCNGPPGGGVKEFSSMGPLPFPPSPVFEFGGLSYVFVLVVSPTVSLHISTWADEVSAGS